MNENRIDRRQVLKGALFGIASASAVLPLISTAASPPVKVMESDPLAQALGYHSNAKTVDVKQFPRYKAGESCSTCSQLQAGTGNERPCNIFSGKLVNVDGWCNTWMQKV